MSEVVHAKFAQNKDIRIQLVNTFPHDLLRATPGMTISTVSAMAKARTGWPDSDGRADVLA